MAKRKPDPAAVLDAFEAKRGERELSALQATIKAQRSEIRQLEKALAIAEKGHSLRHDFAGLRIEAPQWAQSKRRVAKAGDRRAILHYSLSDCHFDEVVDPDQVEGYNAYSRSIATIRLQQWAEKAVRIPQYYLQGYDVEGVVFALLGDMFSGTIHPELAETNEAPLWSGLKYWLPRLQAALVFVADELKVKDAHVVGVVGNHGRMTRKPRAKFRAEDNWDFGLYEMLALQLKDDARFTFTIPTSADCRREWYDRAYLYTHGDQFRGGGGWGGLASPIMRGRDKKMKRDSIIATPAYRMHLGHWHTYWSGPGWQVNGCFPAEAPVKTQSGWKPIGEVEVGDRVLSTDGSMQSVIRRFDNGYSDAGLVSFKVRGLPDLLTATPNHQVLAIKSESVGASLEPKYRHLRDGNADYPQWIPADFISPGDWVNVPTLRGNDEPISPELAWVYGLYLAEGHSIVAGGSSGKHFRIEFSMHEREVPVLARVKAILDAHYPDLSSREWVRKNRTTSHLSYSGRRIAEEFRGLFGHTCYDKRLPEWFYTMSPRLKREVLRGWLDGDGHMRPDGVISGTTVSSEMAWGMFHMALGAGEYPSMQALEPGGRRKARTYTIHLNRGQESRCIESAVFYRVQHRFRNRDRVRVFDLEVSGNHTYCVAGVGVHNSLKGYDEFAYIENFEPEEPIQACEIITPEHGATMFAPIYVGDRKREGW